jgi:hypothetical protein
MDGKDIRHHLTTVTYFNKTGYPRIEDFPNYLDTGDTKRSGYGPGITDADLFTITLSARKVTP